MHHHNLHHHNRSILGFVPRFSRLVPAVAAVLALAPAARSERPDILWMAGGHAGEVNSVAFSPDGQMLASGAGSYDDRDNTIRLWRVSDGALLKAYDQETGTGVLSVQFAPDVTLFAYGRGDATVVVARNPYNSPCPGDLDGDGTWTWLIWPCS